MWKRLSVILVVFVILTVLIMLAVTHWDDHNRNQKILMREISADKYEHLSRMAKETCAGAKYLKSVVLAGPIIQRDFESVHRELFDVSEVEKRAVVISEIAGGTKAERCS